MISRTFLFVAYRDGIMSTAHMTSRTCSSAISTNPDWRSALEEAIQAASESLCDSPDLALLFFSPHHAAAAEEIAEMASQQLAPATVIGCTGESIAGISREVEEEPALSLWLAHWPNVNLTPMHLRFERTAEGGALEGWPDSLTGEWSPGDFLVALADPFTFPADFLLERMNEDRPGVPVIGGMASGGFSP